MEFKETEFKELIETLKQTIDENKDTFVLRKFSGINYHLNIVKKDQPRISYFLKFNTNSYTYEDIPNEVELIVVLHDPTVDQVFMERQPLDDYAKKLLKIIKEKTDYKRFILTEDDKRKPY